VPAPVSAGGNQSVPALFGFLRGAQHDVVLVSEAA